MEVCQRIPAEFIYRPQLIGSGSAEFEYRSPGMASWEEEAVPAHPPATRYLSAKPQVIKSTWSSQAGPWSQQRVHVDAPVRPEKFQVYGQVPAQTWGGMLKEWVSKFVSPAPARGLEGLPQERYGAESLPQPIKHEKQVVLNAQPERFVVEAPPPPVYERVVYVQQPMEARPQQLVSVAVPPPVVAVPAAVPPQPILIPLESEIVCRGHPSDRTELCFGCTLPPRQLKFDIVREEASGCFGLFRSHRFKAVCRKCRAMMPPCQQCGKQSVIRHP
ncbi:hypothetical protein ACSSS7_002237 [Eimeria intestinalis]